MPRKLTQEEFIEKARAIHGNRYDYSLVCYQGSGVPVKIICFVHGVFEQTPGAHVVQKQNCPICSDRKPLGLSEFVKRAREIHGDKYDYSLVEYVNNKTPVRIICQSHGEFSQTPHNHLKQRGCPRCAKNHKLTQEEFLRRAELRHNGFYDYTPTVYTKNADKIKIRCPKHGIFEQEANSHLLGAGCPECGKEKIGQSDYSGRAETRKITVRQKYGVDNVMQDNHIREVLEQSIYEKYGVRNAMQSEAIRQQVYKTKAKNGTWNTSEPEDQLYAMLMKRFG